MRRSMWPLALLLVVGLAIRLAVAWHAGPTGDTHAFLVAARGVARWHFDFYSHVNAFRADAPFSYRNYSYPPAYLPWFVIAKALDGGHVHFWQVARLPPIAADIALGWIVQWYLGGRGASMRVRLGAAAAVVFGPTFLVSSSVEAQIDAVAILPAVIAAVLWERHPSDRRAISSGLLIGIGAAIKTVPILVVLALLPTARGNRERATLIGCAAAIPALLLLPFAFADPRGTLTTLKYGGFPGGGGIATVLQPRLVAHYLGDYDLSGANPGLQRLGWTLTTGGVLIAAAVIWRARLTAIPAAALLWLAVYATSVNWYPQYLAWGWPFFLMAGWVLPVLVSDTVLLVPMVVSYRGLLHVLPHASARSLAVAYLACTTALWLGAAVGASMMVQRWWCNPAAKPSSPSAVLRR